MKPVLLILFGLILVFSLMTFPAQNHPTLVIRNVNLIDGTGKPLQANRAVTIQKGKIVSIALDSKAKPPAGAIVIDGTGKYLIPGLWDMHVHGTPLPGFSELYIANGVTGVRDMYWNPKEMDALRQNLKSGKRTGPRVIAAGRIVDGPKPFWPGSIAVSNAEEGRKAVHTVKSEGSDFVKVYSLLPREGYFAITQEAKKLKIPFAGHVPDSVRVYEASDAGQKSIEHLTGILLECSSKADELFQARVDAMKNNESLFRLWGTQSSIVIATFSEEKANALFKKFVQNNTWQCPTLVTMRNISHLDDETLKTDSRLAYVPIFIRAMWDPKTDRRFQSYTPERYEMMRKTTQKERSLIALMQKSDVKLLAGTDAINPYCYPGFSLHEELELFVQVGLTPMEALQTATRNPAQFLGLEKTLGTIEKGKIADMVLLDANPLADINNTKRIAAVIQGGKLFDRASLDALLESVKKSMGSFRSATPSEFFWAGCCPH
ncbi:MAG: amidohydrolase family protein [Fimbriimonadia bacterium]|nr:amidohydrolase family protein [Fimbriimonadia bacterium]